MGTIKQLRWWTYKILPLAYDDSLSYYEVLAKATQKLNEVIGTTNKLPEAISQEVASQLSGDDTDIYNNLFGGIINAIATKEADEITYTPNEKQGGEIIWIGDTLYEVVTPMAIGTNYIVGTNIVPIDIAGELKKIKEYICTHNEYFHDRATQSHNAQTYLYWKDNLYRVDADIHVDDILSERRTVNDVTTGQLTLVNTMDEITSHYIEMHESDNQLQTNIDFVNDNLQKQVTSNDNDIANLITANTATNTRIDNIVSQSGNDNTEIVDGRLGAESLNSPKFKTIGNAIRGQINNVVGNSQSINQFTWKWTDFVQGNINTNLPAGSQIDDNNNAIHSTKAGFINATKICLNAPPLFHYYLSYYEPETGGYIGISDGSRANGEYWGGDIINYDFTGKQIYVTITDISYPVANITPADFTNYCISLKPAYSDIGTTGVNRKGFRPFSTSDWITVYDKDGSGVIENIFTAGDYMDYHTDIRITCDGITCVDGNIYELIGLPAISKPDAIYATKWFGKTGQCGGIYMNYKIPFYKHCLIELRNAYETTNPLVWFHVQINPLHKIHLGEYELPYGSHCYIVRKTASGINAGVEFDYLKYFSNVTWVGTVLLAHGHTANTFMEGMFRYYKDGESNEYELMSTGLEDFFHGTYYFRTGKFFSDISGTPNVELSTHDIGCYRFFENPIILSPIGNGEHSTKVTLRNNELNIEGATEFLDPTVCDYVWYNVIYS